MIKTIIRETEGMDDETFKMLKKTLDYIWVNHKSYKKNQKQDCDLGYYNQYDKKSDYWNNKGGSR